MSTSNITFDDIAAYTHFSKTTISRYFNHPESLTEKNRLIIQKALEELDYKGNMIGKILASGQSQMVGILIPSLHMHYYADMLDNLLRLYTSQKFKFLIYEGHYEAEAERTYIQELLAYSIDGIIVFSHQLHSKELAGFGIPVVAIEREAENVSSVNTDNYMGGVQATSLLYKNRCDKLYYIDNKVRTTTPSFQRLVGFRDICRERGIPHEILTSIMKGDSRDEEYGSYDSIRNLMNRLVEENAGKRIGIFCANDTYANMIEKYVLRRYGNWPDHIRLIGFDNSPISSEAIVPLSTVGQQSNKIAMAAMELLEEQIEAKRRKDPPPPIAHKVITPILFPRETSVPEY